MELKRIRKDQIVSPSDPMRMGEDRDFLDRLGRSIDDIGLIHPIRVTPTGRDRYELGPGSQRLDAYHGDEIDALVITKEELEQVKLAIEEGLIAEEIMEIQRIHENYIRRDASGYDLEKRLNKYYKKGWKQKKLARLFGMSKNYVSNLLYTYKMRQLLIDAGVDEKFASELSESIIRQTQGLPKEDAINLLKIAVEKGHASTEVRKIAGVVKKAPEKIKQAVFEGTISHVMAKQLLDAVGDIKGISIEEQDAIIGEIKRLEKEESESFELIGKVLRGEIPTELEFVKSPDEKRLASFLDVAETVQWWSWAVFKEIKNEELRSKAIEAAMQMYYHLEDVLIKLGRISRVSPVKKSNEIIDIGSEVK